MLNKKNFLFVIVLFLVFSSNAQDEKFGKVAVDELKEKVYVKDSSAPAAVLFRKEATRYNYVQSSGFQIIKEVHERVKIYNKEGFKYATITERLFKGDSDKESLSSLKGYTYNLENDEIKKVKLKGTEVFSESISKYYDEKKFAMPNVKEGSVIEYQYKIVSPFSYSIDEIELQYDIPIKKQQISITIPEYYSFKTNIKGYLTVKPLYSSNNGKINFNNKHKSTGDITSRVRYSTSTLDYKNNKTSYKMMDVPALKEEPFVNNMDNYRSSVNYELQFVKFPDSPIKNYATTWEKVANTIYKSDNFGKQLDYDKYFKEDLISLLNGKTDNAEKLTAIFSHVQNHMNWNGYRGKYTDEGVKNAYKKQSGNVADINLILIAMCRSAGLKANPVLISTRDNGVPLFPTREGFNYVIASVEMNGKNIFLDACNKYTEPNLLPTSALNWNGRLIKEDGSSSFVSVTPNQASKEVRMMNFSLLDNGDVEGKIRQTRTSYNAYLFRNRNGSVDQDSYLEKMENDNNGIEVFNYKIDNKTTLRKPVVESFDFLFENQADIVGDKIYFTPLLFHANVENPFKLDKRDYPIDFVFPWHERNIVNIEMPEGYKVISIPEPAAFAMPNDWGNYSYRILQKDNTLQVMVDLKMNNAIIPVDEYQNMKELFKKVVEKETEKVVLSKI